MRSARLPFPLLLSVLAAACAGPPPGPPGNPGKWEKEWSRMKVMTPRGYVCFKAKGPIRVDGRLDEVSWAAVPWTEDFVDIEGTRRPAPRFRTRAKMLWDGRFFYVAARLEEPHLVGTITKKNAVIFHDPDFEIFLDPDGDNHFYYEFEMNALNTIWELTLERPYRDGGPVHLGDNMPGLRSAVYLEGTLNDPSDTDRAWTVEIALPWKGLRKYAKHTACPPREGDLWRIDFSRVEWLYDIIDGKYRKIPKESRPEDNWVWSPTGVIDMHRPERWGYVRFSTGEPGAVSFEPDPTLPVRDFLMEYYYLQKSRPSGGIEPLSFPLPVLPGSRLKVEMTMSVFTVPGSKEVTGAETTLHVRGLPGLAGPIRLRRIGKSWTVSAPVRGRDGVVRELILHPDSLLEMNPDDS